MDSKIRRDIIEKIKELANISGGVAPGLSRFEAATGVKRHEWQGKIWKNWGDAVQEAGLAPNELRGALNDESILDVVFDISKTIGRFPTSSDLRFELHHRPNAPDYKTVLKRWRMVDLAAALAAYAEKRGAVDVASYARSYVPPHRKSLSKERVDEATLGYVYMQRHGADFKIGRTASVNRRERQIQIELPQETELIHSILTDDPVGVEAYWHKRFASKRTRGEWFKLAKMDILAFKRWSKIW